MVVAKVRPALVMCALAAACTDSDLGVVHPKIIPEPEALDFGAGVVGAKNSLNLDLLNRGSGALVISGFRVEPNDGIFLAPEPPPRVAPGAKAEVKVAFVPAAPKAAYAATLVVDSNDPNRPALEIPLVGVGGEREIDVSPLDLDFGTVDEGTSPTRQVFIRNVGKDVLTISSMSWTSTSTDLRPLAPRFAPMRLMAMTSTSIEIVYSPRDLGADRGTLTIFSDDEDEPMVVVEARGRANLAPRAIAWGCETIPGQIGCMPGDRARRFTMGLGQRVGLDGRESFDPEGSAVSGFRWVIEDAPRGSTSLVFHSSEDLRVRQKATGDMEVTAPGRYRVRLIVKDARGLESLAMPESYVTVAPRDLEILLRWDIPTDVDLHFVRPGGMVGDYGRGGAGTSTGSDCSTYNRSPNWGDPGSRLDDPRLDLDVVTGRGPEVVSLNGPETNGVYTIWAHYCDSHRVRVPTSVKIEVYVEGVRVGRVPDDDIGFTVASGEAWRGATVQWIDESPPRVVVTPTMEQARMMPELCLR